MNMIIQDKSGEKVILTAKWWQFIVKIHPEMADYFNYLVRTVREGMSLKTVQMPLQQRYARDFIELDVKYRLQVLTSRFNDGLFITMAYVTIVPVETIWR